MAMRSARRTGEDTRRRIILAAAARFAQLSYEEVKLRDIARDVEIDVAYVHRSFGSKEKLFTEVLSETARHPRRITGASGGEDLVAALTENVFKYGTMGFRIFANSLSSPQARDVIRTAVVDDFIGPLAAKLPAPATERAELIMACLAGIQLVREVLRLEPLHSTSRKVSQPMIEAIFRACVDEAPPIAPPATHPGASRPAKRTPRLAATSQAARQATARSRRRDSADSD
jgi:AcrR family transcriptional regulator